MLKKNTDASVKIMTTLKLELFLQRQLSQDETVALMAHLRKTLPVMGLTVREEQRLSATWPSKR